MDFLGAPYRNGGSDPSGFDCSGLVQWVFARHGTMLPREAKDQYRVGRAVDRAEATLRARGELPDLALSLRSFRRWLADL